MASDGVIKSDFMRFFSESLLQLYLKDYFNEQRVVSCCESDPLAPQSQLLCWPDYDIANAVQFK